MRFLDHIEKWKIGLLITFSQEEKAAVSRANGKKNVPMKNTETQEQQVEELVTVTLKYANLPPIFCQKHWMI